MCHDKRMGEVCNEFFAEQDIIVTRSACRSNYKDMVGFVGMDDKVYMGKRENYDNRGHYDNSDQSLVFVSENKKAYGFLYGSGCVLSQEDALKQGVYTKEDYAEFAHLQSGVLSQFEQQTMFCFAPTGFSAYQDEPLNHHAILNISCFARLCYAVGLFYVFCVFIKKFASIFDVSENQLYYHAKRGTPPTFQSRKVRTWNLIAWNFKGSVLFKVSVSGCYITKPRVLKNRSRTTPFIVGGYSKFLFLNRNGLPKVAINYDAMFRGLVKKYNKSHEDALPKVTTPHTLRTRSVPIWQTQE